MKGQAWAYFGLAILLILVSVHLLGLANGATIERTVVTAEGQIVSFENYVEILIRTFNQGVEFISQRAAYDMLKDGVGYAYWTITEPQMDDLKKALENRIKDNLPSGDHLYNDRKVSWGNSVINVDKDSAPCSPPENSECFFVNGEKHLSVFDDKINSRISLDNKINSKISSNYFKLLNAGIAIMQDPQFNTHFDNAVDLINAINSAKSGGDPRFNDLNIEIKTPDLGGITDSLVGYWKFDDCTAKDLSGLGNNGNIVNDPTCISRGLGKAFEFHGSGSDEYIEIPDSQNIRAENNKITIEMWFQRDEVPTGVGSLINKKIVVGGGGSSNTYSIFLPSVVQAPPLKELNSEFISGAGSLSFGLIEDKEWHHIAVTYDGNNLNLYLDGKLFSTKKTFGAVMPVNNNPLRIGGDPLHHNFFNGVIDEVKIYSRALNNEEIQQEYSYQSQAGDVMEVSIWEDCLAKNEFYCISPIKSGETGIIFGGKTIPYDYNRLNFKIRRILPLGVSVMSPNSNDIFDFKESVFFDSMVSGGTLPYAYSWKSNINGVIGSTKSFGKDDLSVGKHTITITVTDNDGRTFTKTIFIDVLPETFDWRSYQGINWMTPVKTQKCGDCWAFASAGVVEAKNNIQYNNPNLDIDLSEQYLVSDCYPLGSCVGGQSALPFIKINGIPDEACYGYLGVNSVCPFRCNKTAPFTPIPNCCNMMLWKISNYLTIPSTNYKTIRSALIVLGPLFVAMRITGWSPLTLECSSGIPNHAAIITGYDNKEGVWILKNSWGTDFPTPADGGYFKVKYGSCIVENSYQGIGFVFRS